MMPVIPFRRSPRLGLLFVLAAALFLLSSSLSSSRVLARETASTDTQGGVTDLDPLVVTARGLPQTASSTPGGVGVILSPEIDRSRPVSLTDITRLIPGVEKTSDSPWGSDINIRGLSRNSVLFLIDGCRVNTATDINARFGLINPSDIERIEVLKGPISALYGWGAMGGVVNVITRRGGYALVPHTRTEIRTEAATNPGGYGAYGLGLYEGKNTWILGSGGYRDYEERESAGSTLVHNSQFRDLYGRLAGGHRWSEKNETEVNLQVMEGQNVGIPGKGLALPQGPDATFPTTRRVLGSATHTLTPEESILTQSKIRLFFQEVDRRVILDEFPAASPLVSVAPGADHATLGINWTSHFNIGDHTPVLGLEAWQWRIDNTHRIKDFKNGLIGIDSSLGNLSQTVGGFFAEDTWSLSDSLSLNLGGRVDATRVKSDDLYNWISPPSPAMALTRVREGKTEADASFQGQAGLTWQIAPRWSATALAALSFRPPDLMDRFKYVNLGGGISLHGNPDLEPEQSRFFETGLHFVSGKLRVSGTAYCNRIREMITEQQVSASRIEMENVDNARIYGAELSGEVRLLPQLKLSASLAWARGDNKTTGEALPYIAPLNARSDLEWNQDFSGLTGGWWAKLSHEWADAQDRVGGGQTPSQSWQTLDLKAGYRFHALGADHELSFGVTNLFDEDYSNFLATSRGMALKEAGRNFSCYYKIVF
ncbi:MAG: TonB-dependent receptor [Desulfobacter sp.]|nr:MAG: TonB-dependent receptor [Desulfobacter sp.]